jgi:O-antigen ligase
VLRIPGGFDLTLERFFFILMLFLFVIGLFSGKVHFRDDVGIEILMGLFIIICFFSMIRTGFSPSSPNYPSPWFILITGYLFPFIAFVYAKYLLIDDTDPLVIFNTLFFLGIYLCIIAFFEYFNLRQFIFPRFIANPNIGIHFDRARGPFLNAAVNGAGILAGFVCGLFLIGKKIGMSKVLYFSLLLLFFPAVFFTQTRSVYLGLIIVLFLFAGWYKTAFPKWKLLSLPLAILLIVAMANSHRFFSADRREGGVYQLSEVQSRIALFERSLAMIAERPFLGVGWAQFIPASNKIYKGRIPFIAESDMELLQHNHLLGLAVELGIGGVSVYIMIIIMVFRRLMQLSGRWTQNGIMGDNLQIVIVMIWCVYLCNNFFIEPSNNLFLNAVPFVFAGLADGLYRRSLKLERKFSATSMESHAHV